MTEEECGTCPACDMSFVGPDIPQQHLLDGYYGEWNSGDAPQYYSLIVGVEVPEVYDGVSYWMCPFCGARWHRFPDEYAYRRRRRSVEQYWRVIDAEDDVR